MQPSVSSSALLSALYLSAFTCTAPQCSHLPSASACPVPWCRYIHCALCLGSRYLHRAWCTCFGVVICTALDALVAAAFTARKCSCVCPMRYCLGQTTFALLSAAVMQRQLNWPRRVHAGTEQQAPPPAPQEATGVLWHASGSCPSGSLVPTGARGQLGWAGPPGACGPEDPPAAWQPRPVSPRPPCPRAPSCAA